MSSDLSICGRERSAEVLVRGGECFCLAVLETIISLAAIFDYQFWWKETARQKKTRPESIRERESCVVVVNGLKTRDGDV